MRKYAIFRYKRFPKRTPKDIRVKVYQSQKQVIAQSIKLNKEAGLEGARYYWRGLEPSEVG